MPKKIKREEFKNKIKKKIKKIQQLIDDFSSSDSDSDSSGGATSASNSEECIRSTPNPAEPDALPQLLPDDNIYLSSGIDKETRKKLIEQYNVPSNCKYLKAPILNPEVEVLLSAADNKKDKFLKNLQEIMGKGIAAGGEALTKILAQRDTVDAAATQALVDSRKLLTDMFHTVSTHRKYQVYKYFNDSVKKIATQQKIDTALFGHDFAEKCKLAKSVEATAKELQKPGPSREPQAPARNLNFQRPPFRKNMKTEGKRGGDRYVPDNKRRQKTSREYRKATDYTYGKMNRR